MSGRGEMQAAIDRVVVNVARMLASRHPETVADVAIDETPGAVVARVLGHASGRPRRELLIRSEDAGATVRLGDGHEHCYDPEYRDAGIVAGRVIALTVAVVRGDRVAYSAWAGDRDLGGGFARAPADLLVLRGRFPNADRFVIRAWGELDRTLHVV